MTLQPQAPPTTLRNRLCILAAIAIGGGIALLPPPAGLSSTAQIILGILVCAVVLWGFQALNNGVISVLMMALLVVTGVKPGLALSGFASSGLWILICVLFYGFAMQRTG